MQASYLQNPRPSDGYRNVVAGARMSSGIDMPTVQSLQQPSIHNNVKEPMVNSTASYPIFVRPYSRDSDINIRHYTECTPLFINKFTSKKELQNNSMMRQVLNLADLNKHIDNCKDKVYCDKWKQSYENDVNNGNIVRQVKATWAFYGIVRNEMDHADYFGSTSHNGQLLLNCDVRGRTRVDNVWGKDVRQGDKLYYLIRKEKDPKCGCHVLGVRNFDHKTKLADTAFGPIKIDADHDELPIFLGVVPTKPIRPTDVKKCCMDDTQKMRASSKVEVFLRI